MSLLRTTSLFQLLIHLDSRLAFIPNPLLHHTVSTFPTLYTPHLFCVPHPLHILHLLPLTAPLTKNNKLPITAHLLVRMHSTNIYIPQATDNFINNTSLSTFFSHTLPTHSPVYTSPLSQPLVLYHLKITAGVSETSHHSDKSFSTFRSALAFASSPHHPYCMYN